MCWSPQGGLLATGTGHPENIVKLWAKDGNSDALVLIRTLVAHKSRVFGLTFTSESELISADLRGTINVWTMDE